MKERWTNKQIVFLKKHYNDFGAIYCSKFLSCSPRRIRIKASRLGITKQVHSTKSKVCKTCYKRKTLTEFSPNNSCLLGLQSKCKICRAKWERNKKQTDKTYQLAHRLKNRIRLAIKNNVKASSSFELLGCGIDFLKDYIAMKFHGDMSWDNYGKWYIDHIKPCSSFDLTFLEQQKLCFHYTNLRPIWTKDNLSKSSRVIN